MLDVSSNSGGHWATGTEQLGVTSVSIALLVCTSFLLVMGRSTSRRKITGSENTKCRGRSIPGPRGLPIFGNIFQLGDKIHETFMKLAEDYGDVFQIYIASRRVVVLNGANAIQQALIRQAVDFAGRPELPSMLVMDKVTSRGLSFASYDQKWRIHRKISETALRHFTSGSQVSNLEEKVMMEVQTLIKFWTNNNSDVDMMINPETSLQLSVSNVLSSFLVSRRHELDDPKLLNLLQLQMTFQEVCSTANMVDFMPWVLNFAPKILNKFEQFLESFKSCFKEDMSNHLEDHQPGAENDIMDYMLTLTEKMDSKDLLKVGLTPENILTSVYDFYGAASDTVPATIMWLLSYMVIHPDIQDRVHEELDSVFGSSYRAPNLEDRSRLPFTLAVIAEAQRHSSVVPMTIPHSTTCDTILKGGYDMEIPKDTVVFVNLYSVHYDKNVYKDPEKFLPERFLASDGSLDKEKTSQLVAFGVGRRRCLGSEIARVELFLYFATLMQHFHFSCPEGEKVSLEGRPGLVTKPDLTNMRIRSRCCAPKF